MSQLRVCVSALAADRLARARDLVLAYPATPRVVIIGESRGSADDLARSVAASTPATFGIERLSLTQLAARSAVVALASHGMTPSSRLGAEAVAARAAFDARRGTSLSYFGPVAETPGFPRALARTLQELRLAAVSSRSLARLPLAGPDLADLIERCEALLSSASTVDRAALFQAATQQVANDPVAEVAVLLDLVLDRPAERDFVATVVAGATTTLATVPAGDRDGIRYLQEMGGVVEEIESADTGDLACLRRYLFTSDAPPVERELDGSLECFSAPGEGRESVEIARRILKEARRGVRFDEMAILVRSPHSYLGLLEHALSRAKVAAWFDRGTRRPHPAGRAFLALLACASERLSAARFAEYLSLGQVPQEAQREETAWVAPLDEALGRGEGSDEEETRRVGSAAKEPGESDSVVAGTLRTPWRWERLLVEAAVIGRDATRWTRRLDGKAKELDWQIKEARRDDSGDDARVGALRQVQDQLRHLRAFAIPIIERLAEWPVQATWGEWLDRFDELAPRVLCMPTHVLRVLADLRPMADVGPVDLGEARRVLSERLLTLESEPPSRRYGRVFVGTPHQARGRSFRVVFVPGLAERMFPQKPREDALMLDDLRAQVGASLPTQNRRLMAERLLLQMAAGAASERLYVSFPRIELSESRARVPSFYALDVLRAAQGRVPDHEELEAIARRAGDAMLAWPAPSRADEAIDDQEHDLAVLRRLLDSEPEAVKGHAHYLLKLNACLRRSVIDRWARGDRRWSANDGLTRVSPHTKEGLAAQRLTVRAYSISALQRFSACPYQFVLSAMYRLRPLEQPVPLQRLDPLTRGSVFHEIQAHFFRALASRVELPVTSTNIANARAALDESIATVSGRMHDELVPAVERVWDDEISSIRRDLRSWLEYVARDGAVWEPTYFEFGFGDVPGERDASSVRHEVTLDGGFKLKGAIDLIEEHRQTKVLRVTDHKTGRTPDRIEKVVIGGGAVLQPVLYAMAVEAAMNRPVHHGRLFYCTSAGRFHAHEIPLNDRTRAAGLEVLHVVDRAIEGGFLAAAPTEGACRRCDFRPVCGSDVCRRILRKPQEPLADLLAIRSRP